jgi:hypothetical protein
MTGAVCPSCGVAVVPGYVRCPKCHKPLPGPIATRLEGGTAVQSTARKAPLVAVLAAVAVGVAILIYLGVRKTDKPIVQAQTTEESDAVAAPEPAATDQPEATEQPSGPNPVEVAASLERTLKKQRLWSTVTVVGGRVEVRSGSCGDAAMAPVLDAAAPAFKAAGLTRLRCLEQSGRVVTERDL